VSTKGGAIHSNNCTTTDKDNFLVTSTADLEAVVNAGYAFKGRQGYIYSACSPEPACMPPGTVKLYRKCTFGTSDCAIFGEPQRSAFESDGYTQAFPSGSPTLLGYAYGAGNSDMDALPDALEHAIGTSISHSDSDGDGSSDSEEYPLAQVPGSDPCDGPAIVCTIPAEVLFSNGFEE